ncbi:cobyric acid synthase [Thalassobaculum sp.]|uniref:cobyric acid synthase n=1 Tax=Thalassobaculum sp. TaxID=2022740 RepID=UPI0032EDB5D4
MAARAIMFQGTGSDVGKSLIVAGLCRLFARRGLAVRPFKPQNMSNNAAVTVDGGEIGRAQALQARAAGIDATVDLNPILLKPETDTGAQIVIHGKRVGHARAREYQTLKPTLLAAVLESFSRLAADADLLLIEGAGSPAEINLREGDIANMGFAHAAGVPVVLVGDIDRGGVIAALVGTHAVLEQADRARVVGYLINRFRGDASLFDDGLAAITDRTAWPSFGVVPWFADAARLPAEDAVALDRPARTAKPGATVVIAVPKLARIANFDDLDPLGAEPSVDLRIIQPGQPLPGNADLVLLPGSKSTIGDLAFLRAQGWDVDLSAHLRRGGRVLGLCGGYQMLGRLIRDPEGIEGPAGEVDGLGLLDVTTTLTPSKTLTRTTARHIASGETVEGYEIHIGRTDGPDCGRPVLRLPDGTKDGATSADGRVSGCYMHGLFTADGFRRSYLRTLGANEDMDLNFDATVDTTLDRLADHLATHLDTEALLAAARPVLAQPTAVAKARKAVP